MKKVIFFVSFLHSWFPDLAKKQNMYKQVSLAQLWLSAKYLKRMLASHKPKHILSFFLLHATVDYFYTMTHFITMSHYHEKMHSISSIQTFEFSVASEPFPSAPWLPVRASFHLLFPPSLPQRRGSQLGSVNADHPPLLPHLRNFPSSVFGSLCWAPVVSEPAGGPVSASPAAWQQ